MKLPKFNDSYPLTLGVSDDYFTLATRIKRLNRAPYQPRPATTWLVCAALLLSFVAVVPLRLTARAQNEAKIATLSGIVKDASGNAVDGATIYLTLRNRAEPLETTNSDKDGRYEFSSEIGENRFFVVWADAGTRGLGQSYISQDKSGARLSNPVVAPLAPVKLLLVAPDGTRAANVRLRVGQMGEDWGEQTIVPRPLAQKLQTQTNARGEALFAGLPGEQTVQFWLSDQKYYPIEGGFGDLRGGQYAPLGSDDAVKVGHTRGYKTIRLLAPVTLSGRVTTPAGTGKSGALVLAQSLGTDAQTDFLAPPFVARARAGANGNYEIKGLRPQKYLVEVESEPWLARDYVSRAAIEDFVAPTRTIDVPLIRGGLVRGVLLREGTGQPLSGQTVQVLDDTRKYQQQKTDAQGRFQFRAVGGMAFLWTQNGAANFKWPARFFNTGQLAFEATKIKFYEEKAGRFSENGIMTDGTIKITPRNYVKSRRDTVFGASSMVTLPVKEGATRDITLEVPPPKFPQTTIRISDGGVRVGAAPQGNAKPAKRTGPATLTGKVSRPDGSGLDADIVLRPTDSDDMTKAIFEKADAQGFYRIEGLQPGRYRVSADLDKITAREFAAPKMTQTVKAGANRADIKLVRGVLIEGRVISRITKQALRGINVVAADADGGNATIVATDAQGKFRFRVRPGTIGVRVQKAPNGAALRIFNVGTPNRIELPAYRAHILNLQDGYKRQIQFELPPFSANAATPTGTIVGTARVEVG